MRLFIINFILLLTIDIVLFTILIKYGFSKKE